MHISGGLVLGIIGSLQKYWNQAQTIKIWSIGTGTFAGRFLNKKAYRIYTINE